MTDPRLEEARQEPRSQKKQRLWFLTVSDRTLYFGDNLDVLARFVKDESIDLVYLDPPFNSKKSYNVLFKDRDPHSSNAQIEAFDDTWHWTSETQAEYERIMSDSDVPHGVSTAVEAFRKMLGENDVMAYLVMMAPRLLEIHRVIKPTGSMFLHCDPTAGHYLKIICDRIFSPENFRNEIAWCYRGGGVPKNAFARKHDLIFFYAKGRKNYFKPQYVPYSEASRDLVESRGGVSIDDLKRDLERGAHMPDWWTDINSLQTWSPERLGFKTQKPVALLRRIIDAACPEDGTVLDPFCGCGTTVAAAEELKRSWTGIDITYVAISLIEQRLVDTFGDLPYEVHGVPADMAGAEALFRESPKNFEVWAARQVGGRPNPKMGGDEGIDGVIRFYIDGSSWGTVYLSIKGGETLNPSMVRDLIGTLDKGYGDMGALITRVEATSGMRETAAKAGSYTYPPTGQKFPRIQILSVEDIFNGKRLNTPPVHGTYAEAPKYKGEAGEQLSLEGPQLPPQ